MSGITINTGIILSSSHDPWYNLALEEYLLNRISENQVFLYLWQNEDTVVIGKHQNAWKECLWQELENDGGKLARRLSGGGAVFHDLGNLNFTFLIDRKLYNLESQMQVVIRAVENLGIDAEFSGRNDLTAGGKKFSGSAFYFKAGAALHHGTLLINTDLEKLVRYLQVSREKIISKGVDSVRARVVNLSELNPGVTVEAALENMKKSFAEFYGGPPEEIQAVPVGEDFERLYRKHASWEWRYGETPQFDLSLSNRFAWGGIEIGLRVRNGYITSAVIYSDALDCETIEALAGNLGGLPLRSGDIVKKLDEIAAGGGERLMIEDLKSWLLSKLL
ncbi:MAG: lipoate--protein ligase [Bacillota bacterium]|nr:lipoate--protein ligase [Bacillota bacterium]